jgi:predicted TIM-barrel fold metal-dependent hydrolase
VVAAPGAHKKWFKANNVEGLSYKEMTGKPIKQPATWRTGDGRLALLDEHGLHGALVFPTLASVIEERLGAKADTTAALFNSLNRWVEDEFGYARANRLYPVPYVSLSDVDQAIAELERVLKLGARSIGLRPAPVPVTGGGRSLGAPEHDPFYARVAEAGIFVALHASDSGYDKINQWWLGGQGKEFLPFDRDPFKASTDGLGRAISDAVSSMICHGVFARHPKLKVASVENGATWVRPVLHRLGRVYGQMPQAFKANPVDTFHKHFWVAPFYEDDLVDLRKYLPIERMLFGSDFPHPEGVALPLDYLEEFTSFKPVEVEQVFSSNLKGLIEGRAK